MQEVIVTGYDPRWPELFAEEAGRIRQAMGDTLVAVEHVGSTAVPGLSAKPILDILVSVPTLGQGERMVPALATLGYECRGENGIPGRLLFRKGLVQFRRTHHLHMVEVGHAQWASLLLFRDHLRAHPDAAQQYEALKQELATRFCDDRAAYSAGKADFIRAILEQAREENMDNVVIVDYDPRWRELYAEAAAGLRQALGAVLVTVEHIGSTSVPGLAAKPIIDIQVVIRSVSDADEAAPALAALGWARGTFTAGPYPERHLYFKKNDAQGTRTHQLHAYEAEHPAAAAHLLFRDHLRAHPEEAMRYEDLKRGLAERHRHDRLAYNDAKTAYVEAVLTKARG